MNEEHRCERPCPVCGGRKGLKIVRLRYALFDDLEISGQKTLVECAQCGMLYDDVHFSENKLREYYRCNEHYALSGVGGSGSFAEDNGERYDRIINLLKPDSNGVVIDFGCGQGGFILRCLQHGLRAVGIEPSAKSRRLAQEAGLRVYESLDAFVTDNPVFNKIQYVVFSHVLEHLMNPADIVRVFAKYANDASVYIEVPDADSYLSPNAVRWQEMYFEHISHFRERNIAEFARRSSIEIRNKGEIPFSKLQQDVRCRFIVGHFTDKQASTEIPVLYDYEYDPILQLPFPAVENLAEDERPFGLWGVSQYAMLLMGSCAKLSGRVRRIFDSSPAKIGRSIRGIIVESSSNIGTLNDDFILLIPKSNFLQQMRSLLPGTGFKGKVVEV